MDTTDWRASPDTIAAIVGGRHGDPFGVLGPHAVPEGLVVRAFLPGATAVSVLAHDASQTLALVRRDDAGFFEGLLPRLREPFAYKLHVTWADASSDQHDVFAFAPVLGAVDDHLLVEGTHRQLYERLGAHLKLHQGVEGVHFAVWAPHASRVSVVGHFNLWDGRRHPMRKRIDSGVWEIFIPEMTPGAVYKYEIVDGKGVRLPLKADPFAFQSEMRPSTASVVARPFDHAWRDADYMRSRAQHDPRRQPMSIYEVHLGSWRRHDDGSFLSWSELESQLIPYVAGMGFTHIELLPISEHPLDASWGYQPIGLFAPSSRFGAPQGFAALRRWPLTGWAWALSSLGACYFPTDEHGLARFDGTALYEHADPRRGFHPDWNTAIYDLGPPRGRQRAGRQRSLIWLDRFHLDALRVDAVASMLYLDYSRKAGEWLPNEKRRQREPRGG